MPEPRRLRHLRWLVNTLTVTLIAGFLIVVAAIVIRISRPVTPALPPALTLPAGETAAAVTLGTGWVAVVTRDGGGTERIRVFDAGTGSERQALELSR